MEDISNTQTNTTEEEQIENTLRPKQFENYIGQKTIKNSLNIAIQAARKREESLEHVLLYGPPGLGKTTLAHIIATEMQANIKILSGPTLERSGDLASILTNLEKDDILFIDEIHRLNKTIEEILYPAMEDYALDIILGKGPGARNIRIDLPPFTIIGATTKVSSLSTPLRDRFGHIFHFNYYQNQEISKIMSRSAKILEMEIDNKNLETIAKRARRTPRIANRLLKRIRDYAEVHNNGKINKEIIIAALKLLHIDELGLDEQDRNLLKIIIEKFNGGPVGLNTLGAATGEDKDTIENVYEPYLIQQGLLKRTPKGRVVTPNAYNHLSIDQDKNQLL